MSEGHIVIIGNGPAGNQAAISIRENDPEVQITLISRESGACCRPKLFPDLIAGSDRGRLRPGGWCGPGRRWSIGAVVFGAIGIQNLDFNRLGLEGKSRGFYFDGRQREMAALLGDVRTDEAINGVRIVSQAGGDKEEGVK